MTQHHLRRLTVILSAVFACCLSLEAGAPLELRTLVVSGDPSPVGPASWVFQRIGFSMRNDQGQLLFQAQVGEPVPLGDGPDAGLSGLFLKDGGEVGKVLLEGDPLPGGDSFQLSDALPEETVELNNSGEVAVLLPSRGILLEREGQLEWLAEAGQPVPQSA